MAGRPASAIVHKLFVWHLVLFINHPWKFITLRQHRKPSSLQRCLKPFIAKNHHLNMSHRSPKTTTDAYGVNVTSHLPSRPLSGIAERPNVLHLVDLLVPTSVPHTLHQVPSQPVPYFSENGNLESILRRSIVVINYPYKKICHFFDANRTFDMGCMPALSLGLRRNCADQAFTVAHTNPQVSNAPQPSTIPQTGNPHKHTSHTRSINTSRKAT
jgi:hypothetical protein